MCHDSLKKRTMNVYPENNFYIDILERVEKLIYNLFRKQKFMIKNNGDENGMFKNLKIKIRYVNSADLYMYVYEDNVVVTASLYYKEEYIQRFILDSQSWINSAQQELLLENKDSKLPHKEKSLLRSVTKYVNLMSLRVQIVSIILTTALPFHFKK